MNKRIEDAFTSVSLMLFKKPLLGMGQYEKWLKENSDAVEMKSVLDGTPIYMPPFVFYPSLSGHILTLAQSLEYGKRKISPESSEQLTLSTAKESLKEISLFSPDALAGKNISTEKCGIATYCQDCYSCSLLVRSKYCAYSIWPRECDYCFGTYMIGQSSYCIHCYNSVKLIRCFEVSNSMDCSDCYFCYNCEGMTESMFCFNAKSLRYAIGNVQYPKEEYLKIKKLILDELSSKIEKDKKLELSIFNIGAKKCQI